MALDENEHQILREIQSMNSIVEEANYIGSPVVGEPPRIYVQFKSEINDIPPTFQQYSEENRLEIIRDRWDEIETGDYLFIDIQHKDEL